MTFVPPDRPRGTPTTKTFAGRVWLRRGSGVRRLRRRVQSSGRLSERGAATGTEAPARLQRVLALRGEDRGQVRSAVGTAGLAAVERLAAMRALELSGVRRPRNEIHEQREDAADEGEERPQQRPRDVPLLGVDVDPAREQEPEP